MSARFLTELDAPGLELRERAALPTAAPDIEKLFAVDVNGIASVRLMSPTGLVTDIQRDESIIARNETGVTIPRGSTVRVIGASLSSHGLPATRLPLVALAQANAAATMPAVGVTLQDIPNNTAGRVLERGMLINYDTSAFTAGARLWVSGSTPGALTANEPSDHVQEMALVVRSHATEGQLFIWTRAEHVASEGTLVPSGGASGAVLRKSSATSWNSEWATLAKADIGLGDVDNTSDLAKPVSTDTQTALDAKAPLGHTHPVTDLTTTGTRDSTTFLRGDSVWAVPAGGNGSGYLAGSVPDGSTLPVITHNLGTYAVQVIVRDAASGLIVPVPVETVDGTGALALNAVRLSFNTAPTAGQYTYLILAGAPVSAQTVPVPPVTLVDAPTVSTDAALGVHFRLTTGAARTIGAPTNPTDGQRGLWEINATAAVTITFATGSAGAFEATEAVPSAAIAVASGKALLVGAMWSAARSRWMLMASTATA